MWKEPNNVRGMNIMNGLFMLYRGGQYYWCRKPEEIETEPNCCKSLTNFIKYASPLARIEFTTLTVIGNYDIVGINPTTLYNKIVVTITSLFCVGSVDFAHC